MMKSKIGAQSELLGLILVISLTMFISCGNDGDGGEVEIFKNLNGAWAGPCTQKGDNYAREKLVFYEQTGEMAYIIEEFQTNDCSDVGMTDAIIGGIYDTGNVIDCLSGIHGKCSELDFSLSPGGDYYSIYSINGGLNPYLLYLSEPSNNPESRSEDVEIISPFYKDVLLHYHDFDGDGYGDPNSSINEETQLDGYVLDNTDCNDSDTSINRGAAEIPGDGIDQNCNGIIDMVWYEDNDNDGYGNPDSIFESETQPDGYVSDNTDCNDSDLNIHAGAVEIPGDGIDQNCNGYDTFNWYEDKDNDGYGDPNSAYETETQPDGYVSNNQDADDNDPVVNPGLVIVEIATGTWCSYCPGAAIGADDLVENGHRVGVINYHRGDPYETSESMARIAYYGITGFPAAEFDGILKILGGQSFPNSLYSTYLPLYETQIGIPPLFYIDAKYHNTGENNYQLVIEAKRIGDYPSMSGIVLQAVLTESNIDKDWYGMDSLNFVCRDMIPDENGTSLNFDLNTTHSVILDFTIPAAYIANNLEVIVFLQDNSTKEILQGVFAQLVAGIE